MEIRIDRTASIEEVTSEEFNASEINQISGRYRGLRQQSKAPT